MTLEEEYKLLLEKKRHQEKYDPGLKDISILNAPDVLGEGLGEETFAATEGMSPEARATLSTIARIAPDTAGLIGSGVKNVYDLAKRGFYDDLPDIPKNFGQSGAIHGINSKLFPASWKGPEGRGQKLLAEGKSPDEIAKISRDETGFVIQPKHLYNDDGTFKRTDWKMSAPDINLNEGKYSVDDLEDLDPRQTYAASDFRTNPSLQAGYGEVFDKGSVNLVDDAALLGEPMDYALGKYANKGKSNYRLNKEADYIPSTEDSLLPKFAAADQGMIQEIERFAPGGRQYDPGSANLAGNVEQRAVEKEMRTILDMRAEGMSNLDIIDELGNNHIFKNMDTPDVLQRVMPRSKIVKDTQALEGELVATHSLTADNLERVSEAGAQVNPSIAISKRNKLPPNFGGSKPVRLFYNRDYIDPTGPVAVTNKDAWTPNIDPGIEGIAEQSLDMNNYARSKDINKQADIMRMVKNDKTDQSKYGTLISNIARPLKSLDDIATYKQNLGRGGMLGDYEAGVEKMTALGDGSIETGINKYLEAGPFSGKYEELDDLLSSTNTLYMEAKRLQPNPLSRVDAAMVHEDDLERLKPLFESNDIKDVKTYKTGEESSTPEDLKYLQFLQNQSQKLDNIVGYV